MLLIYLCSLHVPVSEATSVRAKQSIINNETAVVHSSWSDYLPSTKKEFDKDMEARWNQLEVRVQQHIDELNLNIEKNE